MVKQDLGHERASLEINYVDQNLQAHNFSEVRHRYDSWHTANLAFLTLLFFSFTNISLLSITNQSKCWLLEIIH